MFGHCPQLVVLGRNVISVYPPLNGMTDTFVPILNTIFHPRVRIRRTIDLHIMWSGTHGTQRYRPNHFVPLMPPERVITCRIHRSLVQKTKNQETI